MLDEGQFSLHFLLSEMIKLLLERLSFYGRPSIEMKTTNHPNGALCSGEVIISNGNGPRATIDLIFSHNEICVSSPTSEKKKKTANAFELCDYMLSILGINNENEKGPHFRL